MNAIDLKRIFSEKQELLSLPQTLAEVLRIVRDDRSTADDLAEALMKDPALTARTLRVVNSAFYGGDRKIGSMTQAVTTLGLRQITALALSSSVYNLADKWQTNFDRIKFWRHSLEVAIASRMIAEQAGYTQIEEAFVAGLLHDIGLLILDHSFPEQSSHVWKEASRHGNLTDAEQEMWGTDHARVGQFVLEQWQLPESICGAVGAHHAVFVPGTDDRELVLGQVVCLANLVSRFTIADLERQDATMVAEHKQIIQNNLTLSREQLYAIEKNLFSETISMAKFLEMDIGSPEDLLTEANRLLFEQFVAVEGLLNENRHMHQQIVRDQFRHVSLESLRGTTVTFAKYLQGAVVKICKNAEEVQQGIELGSINDPKGLVSNSIQVILNGIETVRSITDELKKLSALEVGAFPDEAEIAEVEEKIRQQLESIDLPSDVCS
jgi:putative nucleotidyltransferase with HDIG domain